MDRKKIIFKLRFKYIIMLSMIFLVLLAIFDLTVYAVAKNSLYKELDDQMIEASEHIALNKDGALENFLNGKDIVYYDDGSNYVISYKIFLLLRDENGVILNSEYLNSFDYMMNIEFSGKNKGKLKVENTKRNGETLFYRTFTMGIKASDDNYFYLQMATDSTGIEMSLRIILKVLIICTVTAMFLVVIVGWYMTKSLVKGVEEGWKKQDEFRLRKCSWITM